MFRQAKVMNHEYLSERERCSAARFSGPATRAANCSEVQSPIMNVSPGDVYRCRDKLVTREIVGETIIVPISGELADLQRVYALNETGGFVWRHLDGVTALESIQQALTEAFNIGKHDAWADIAELVSDLDQAGLIEKV